MKLDRNKNICMKVPSYDEKQKLVLECGHRELQRRSDTFILEKGGMLYILKDREKPDSISLFDTEFERVLESEYEGCKEWEITIIDIMTTNKNRNIIFVDDTCEVLHE